MKTFREFLKEAEDNDLKLKKLRIQLDAVKDDLNTHKRMREFDVKDTESSTKWSEKLQALKDKATSLENTIKSLSQL